MPKPSVIRFGPFTADLDSGELLRKGVRLRLQSQPFQLLTLLTRPGEVSWEIPMSGNVSAMRIACGTLWLPAANAVIGKNVLPYSLKIAIQKIPTT
jgi:hypothetical protein